MRNYWKAEVQRNLPQDGLKLQNLMSKNQKSTDINAKDTDVSRFADDEEVGKKV